MARVTCHKLVRTGTDRIVPFSYLEKKLNMYTIQLVCGIDSIGLRVAQSERPDRANAIPYESHDYVMLMIVI